MKRLLFSCLLVALTVAPAFAQTVPELPFESIPDPLTLPDDVHFGEIAGVAVNSKGHVFVFSRGNSTGPSYMATASQLLEFDANGRFVREIGGGGFTRDLSRFYTEEGEYRAVSYTHLTLPTILLV